MSVAPARDRQARESVTGETSLLSRRITPLLLPALLMWLGMAVAMVVNGTVRDLLYQPLVGYEWGHAISCIPAIAIVMTAGWMMVRRHPGVERGEWAVVGLFWLLLTLLFEFGMGIASGAAWETMLADYDITRGRLWPLVLIATFIAPLVWSLRRSPG